MNTTPQPLDQLPFAKPAKRLVDRQAVEAYARQKPGCEVAGCRARRSVVETHHIISRKMGGSDVASNLLRLCGFGGHHTIWHTIGGHEFYRRHENQLSEEAREKVRAALRIDPEPTP